MGNHDRSPREAVERFLTKRQADGTDRTLRSYHDRLKRFLEWCETNEHNSMAALDPMDIDDYDLHLRELDSAPSTLKGRLATLRVFLNYCANINLVDDQLVNAVEVPTLSRREEHSQERLETADAKRLLNYFRESPAHRGTAWHAFLEVAWHTGARVGGLHALDLGDVDLDAGVIQFRHRPETGTGLKNKEDGKRPVGVSEHVTAALRTYIQRERSDKRDEYGREPLWAGRQGRQSISTLRTWSYQSTQPCLYRSCPHGKQRPTCTWTDRDEASKCPSSRSPHRIRTGSITWQLNQGIIIEDVAKKVNASPSTIRRFYDAATVDEEFNERRRESETNLDINDENEDDE